MNPSQSTALSPGGATPDTGTPHPRSRRAVGSAIWEGAFHIFGGFGVRGTTEPDDIGNDLWRYRDGWDLVENGGPPAARYPSLLATPPAILSFGGCGFASGGLTFFNTLWSFDGRWKEIGITGVAPEPRYTSAMAIYQDSLFVFGGHSQGPEGEKTYYGDLWRFSEGTWEKLHDAEAGPGRRYGFGWVSTADTLYIFGGFDGRQDRADLWALNLATLAWDCLVDGPPARYCPALGHVNGKLVLFGGRSKTNPRLNLSDTWIYDQEWRCAEGPEPGYHAKSAYASDGESLWIYGGEGPVGHVSDLWKFDDKGWRLIQPARTDDPTLW